MDLLDDARSMGEDLAQLRKELHQEPEIGLELPRTQEYVLGELDGLGLEISTGTGDHLGHRGAARRRARRGRPRGRCCCAPTWTRCPIDEESGLDFAATNGAMHACGHDLHTAA